MNARYHIDLPHTNESIPVPIESGHHLSLVLPMQHKARIVDTLIVKALSKGEQVYVCDPLTSAGRISHAVHGYAADFDALASVLQSAIADAQSGRAISIVICDLPLPYDLRPQSMDSETFQRYKRHIDLARSESSRHALTMVHVSDASRTSPYHPTEPAVFYR